MGNIYDVLGGPSKKHQQAIEKLIDPLARHLGVDRFWRSEHGVNGTYSLVGNYPPTAELFFGNNHYRNNPYFRHPKFFQNGYCIPEQLKRADYEETQGQLKIEGHCFHVLIGLHKHEEGFVDYGFASSRLRCGFEEVYLNNLSLFDKFIAYFNKEASKITQEANLEGCIQIDELLGDIYSKNPKLSRASVDSKKSLDFLLSMENDAEKSRLIMDLSKSECACLKLYLSGKTTKEIAGLLYRSPRTIEAHLENSKGKLGINTRSELFDFLRPFVDVI